VVIGIAAANTFSGLICDRAEAFLGNGVFEEIDRRGILILGCTGHMGFDASCRKVAMKGF